MSDLISRLAQHAENLTRASLSCQAERGEAPVDVSHTPFECPDCATNAVTIELLRDAASALTRLEWRCFHCDEVFTAPGAACDHFGASQGAESGCLIDRVAVEEGGKPERGRGLLMALRKAEADIAQLRRDCEGMENDSRLWHEAEADRVRRIGNVQWWQEMDYREGEKLALTERAEAAEAALTRLRQETAQYENAQCASCQKHLDTDEEQAAILARLQPTRQPAAPAQGKEIFADVPRCTCAPVTAVGVMVKDPRCPAHGTPVLRFTVGTAAAPAQERAEPSTTTILRASAPSDAGARQDLREVPDTKGSER
jgi:hypothetical protein